MSERTNINDGNWHLDRRVNIAYIFGAITIAGSILVWAMQMEARTAVLEETSIRVDKRIDRVEIHHAVDFDTLQNRFDRQDVVLDRIEDMVRERNSNRDD